MQELHFARLIHITPDIERHIVYCARASSKDQANKDIVGLLSYCAKHGHWSIFEMGSLCMEITTTNAIAPQILRHKSMSFQQMSFRYANPAEAGEVKLPSLLQSAMLTEWRLQDEKNRQNSIVPSEEQQRKFAKYTARFADLAKATQDLYDDMLADGIAKESARNVLPVAQPTRLYMHGNIRSWIHYLQARTDKATQLEHRLIAQSAEQIFKQEMPIIGAVLDALR